MLVSIYLNQTISFVSPVYPGVKLKYKLEILEADNEKRKYPQRQHFCVLVAESFDRRYFNVIQLMSLNIPMIAIQADLLEVNGDKILNFSKIIDIYIEPEEEEETKQVNETTWNTDAPWTNSAAKDIFEFLKPKHARM